MVEENVVFIPSFGMCLVLEGYEGNIVDSECNLILTEEDQDSLLDDEIQYVLYKFGDFWFFTDRQTLPRPDFRDLIYVGECIDQQHNSQVHLGVRGCYELLNGMHDYSLWCSKARFLNHNALGICEKNTLAGTLAFQLECLKYNIKPIIGETFSIEDGENLFDVKLFAQSSRGWKNLLKINNQLNSRDELSAGKAYSIINFLSFDLTDLIVIATPLASDLFLTEALKAQISIFYQIDTTEFDSDRIDKIFLLSLQRYLNRWLDKIPPVLISESLYLEKEYFAAHKKLTSISKTKLGYDASNQFYKSDDQSFDILYPLFNEKIESGFDFKTFFATALLNKQLIASLCNFKIDTKSLKLPKYNFTNGLSSEDFLIELLTEAIDVKLLQAPNIDIYIERIEREFEVIRKMGFIDYFLILWDIFQFAKRNDILTGIGRGSGAGSLICFLLDITQIDPIKHDTLFERFLNEGRTTSLPDIDSDFPGQKRGLVKAYMEKRFGFNNVCSIGTYGTLAFKAAIKDLARQEGVAVKDVNYINAMVDLDDESKWSDLFLLAQFKAQTDSRKVLKEFIQSNYNLFNSLKIILNQPRTTSIHAAGVVVVPDKDLEGNPTTISDWMPVRKTNGLLVSEWEGSFLEKAGFLKNDILGIHQLDKFEQILQLIKETTSQNIVLSDISLDDKLTFQAFQRGDNEDVFQFGTQGFKSFCKELKPTVIEDLTAMVALFRPGPLAIGANKKYIKLKNSSLEERLAECDPILYKLFPETYGTIVYQEQVMRACQMLAGFTLIETDNIRRAMGKKILSEMQSYEEKFVEGCVRNGIDRNYAQRLWEDLVGFAGYAFNKSHSISYSITGYYSQYLKVNYPLEFWTISLQKTKTEEGVMQRISEISRCFPEVKITPIDINKSAMNFICDKTTMQIFPSISTISFVGEACIEAILNERERGGMFYSMSDFLKRINKSKVKRQAVINLILSGAFDEVEDIVMPKQRFDILRNYCSNVGVNVPIELASLKTNLDALKIQRSVGGIVFINYETHNKIKLSYFTGDKVALEDSIGCKCVVGGEILQVVQRDSKKGKFGVITLFDNGYKYTYTMWPEACEVFIEEVMINFKLGKHLIISGIVKEDSFRNTNQVYSLPEQEMQLIWL